MNIEIKIDSSCIDPKIIIMTASVTEKVNNIIKILSEDTPRMITGIKEDKAEILEKPEIIRIYSDMGKTVCAAEKGTYIIKRRLYEIEDLLSGDSFVRISNSEIINLKKVNNFDMSFAGTICVKLSNGETVYVSRRYVSKIKKILGL